MHNWPIIFFAIFRPQGCFLYLCSLDFRLTMPQNPLLRLESLNVLFKQASGWFPAVTEANFSLEAGKTLGIVGESGSGKSVTSLALIGLLPPGQSRVEAQKMIFEGHDILHLNYKQRSAIRGNRMAMIFQEPMTSLNPVFRCGYQVAEAIQAHRPMIRSEAYREVIELFHKVKLPRPAEMFRAYPHEISGGQKQRVMIAMAIANKPSLLIADEPTTALDVTVQKDILNLLKSLQQETGMAMIFISHDLNVVGSIADTIAVMHQGRIVEQGDTHRVMHAPHHNYTKNLLACRPPKDVRLSRLPVSSEFNSNRWPGGPEQLRKELAVDPADRLAWHNELYTREPLLKVDQLKVWFPVRHGLFAKVRNHIKAVDTVSFEVFPGETLGLVGESGCGKTTLGRAILRLQTYDSGSVIYENQDITKLGAGEMRRLRKKIQIVFQDPYSSLNPRIPIGEAIKEPMIVHGLHGDDKTRKAKVMELLHQVGMEPDHYYRYPHEFSGGQRQRICIARALAVEPRLLVCDESVSALDVSVQAQVLNLLNKLKIELGLTYIFISHDLSVVRFMSDRIMVMRNGIMEELAEADSLYENPQNEYTRKLIAAIP